MSGKILLDGILETQKEKSYPSLDYDDFFEVYCTDNILLNYDLSTEEIESGIVDGPADAGIDAAYVLINRLLLTEDFEFDTIKQPVDIELFVIQVKNQDTFKESPVDKLCASLPLLLNSEQSTEQLNALFRPQVVSIFRSFIEAMKQLANEFPEVFIHIFYCCKGDKPNQVMKSKSETLQTTLEANFVKVNFTFLGAQELYDRSRKQKRLTKELQVVGSPLSGVNSYVALCTLSSYVGFVEDEDNVLLTRMFEANVRAYQGEIEVNKEIAASLAAPTEGIDFWWLNNGITIVADQAKFMNNRLTIENPLIVNGLQTTHEIYKHSRNNSSDDSRMVLIRVIVETDRAKRDEIIRATNRQTAIKHSSFKATEPIHKEIEDYLLTIGFYYDRRKNFYKREGKPTERIISIDRLAQAVLAVLKQEPHTARARPTTAIKDTKNYQSIFSANRETHPLKMYGTLAKMLVAVESEFRAIATIDNQAHRNNLKFHVLMTLAWALNENTNLSAKRISQLDLSKITDELLQAVISWVFDQFDLAGAVDKIAKDADFTKRLLEKWSPPKSVASN